MAAHFTTLNSEGLLPIPVETQDWLGIHPGVRFEIVRANGEVILRPAPADDLMKLCGVLAGGPDLVDELQRERRQEDW